MLKDLTYNVVVLDDEEELYEDYIEFIKNKLDMEGYIVDHERMEEMSELEEYPISNVDLFLVDLKFGSEDLGPQFIQKIRENYYTDILFYSNDSKKIRECRQSGDYQGVFFAIRDENTTEIYDMIAKLIEKMIKRSNTPLSSRGIVLGCVAEIDNIIKEKIELLSLEIDSVEAKRVLDSCTKIFYEFYKSNSKKVNEFWGCDFFNISGKWVDIKQQYIKETIPEIANDISITDSNKNLRILLKIYESVNGKDEKYDTLKNLITLLTDRNIFAHVQEELNSDELYQFKRLNSGDFLILTEEKCRELRTSIIKYCEVLSYI